MSLTVRSLRWLAVPALVAVLSAPVVLGAQMQQPQSESQLRAAIAAEPRDPGSYLDLARLYVEQGRFDEAVTMITNALALTRAQAQTARPAQASIDASGAIRVGGDIAPPAKTKHVAPVYPQEAQDARIEGLVIIEALIGPDGLVQDTTLLRSVHMLDQAAVDAVSQWEFTPTLLNGQPTSVLMNVTVNFSTGR